MTNLKVHKNFQLKRVNKKLAYWAGVLILVVIHIFVSLQTVAFGSDLSRLEKEKAAIEKENAILNTEMIEKTSLTKLSQKSEDYGFVKPGKTIYLSQDEEVAVLRESVR